MHVVRERYFGDEGMHDCRLLFLFMIWMQQVRDASVIHFGVDILENHARWKKKKVKSFLMGEM